MFLTVLFCITSLVSFTQTMDCDMIEMSLNSSEDNLELIEVNVNIPDNGTVDYSWTIISDNGDVFLTENSSTPVFEIPFVDNNSDLLLCLDLSVNLAFEDLFCSVCQIITLSDNEWVLLDEGNENGEGGESEGGDDGEGGENEDGNDLIFEIECDNEWIEVSLVDLGMTEESFFDMLNSDLNNDGIINDDDSDMLAFLLGCNDIELENNNPIDTVSESAAYTFECNGEYISVSPMEMGFTDEEFEILIGEYDLENSEMESTDNFLALLFGCEEAQWNDEIDNEEEVMYESFVFECQGEIITLEYDVLDMDIFDFTELLNLDLNQDEELNEEDLTFLFSCDNDSIEVNWLSAINTGEIPEGFSDFIYSMMNTESSSFSYTDFLNDAETTGLTNFKPTSKRLLKITNLLGEKVPLKSNDILFYIYDDGSIEKKIFIK